MKRVTNLAFSGVLVGGLLGMALAGWMFPSHSFLQPWVALAGAFMASVWSWNTIEPLQGRSRWWMLMWVFGAMVGGGASCVVEWEHQTSRQSTQLIKHFEHARHMGDVTDTLLPTHSCPMAQEGARMLKTTSMRLTHTDKIYMKEKVLGLAPCLGDKVVFDLLRHVQLQPTYQWGDAFLTPIDGEEEMRVKATLSINKQEWCKALQLDKCHLQPATILLNSKDYHD